MQHLSDLVSSTTNTLKTSQQQAVEYFQNSLRDDMADWPRRIQQELRMMKLDNCTEEHQLALSCLQSIPISESVFRIETKHSTPMLRNPGQFSQSLQKFAGNVQTFDVDNQPSHDLVTAQFLSTDKSVDSWAPPFYFKGPDLKTIVGTLSIYNFPIGFLQVKQMKKSPTYDNSTSDRNNWSYSIEFSLFPSSWISKRIIRLSLALYGGLNRTLSIDLALKQACYNDNPSLIRYMHGGDIPGLQKLFEEGEARPTDIVKPWGDSLLHVHGPL